MTNTIAIAVGCAVGYMALAVGLLLYCRHRRLKSGDDSNDDDDDEDDDNEAGILNRRDERRGGSGIKKRNGASVTPHGIVLEKNSIDVRTPGDGMTIELRGTEPNGIYQFPSDQSSSLYHKYEVIGSDFGGGGGGGGNDTEAGLGNSLHSKNSVSNGSSGGVGSPNPVSAPNHPVDVRLTFQRQNLESLGMLGRGEFGDVFVAKARGIRGPADVDAAGNANSTLVFVKSLLTKDENQRYEFKLEVEKYAKLNHAHVAALLALCREVEPHFMIVEYPEWGDLKQYLLASRKEKSRSGKGGGGGGEEADKKQKPRAPPLSSAQKITIIQQVFWAGRGGEWDLI